MKPETAIGRFTLCELIGSGSESEVWRATCEGSDLVVALKIYKGVQNTQALCNELSRFKGIDCSVLPRSLEVFIWNDSVVSVMEDLRGRNLATWIRSQCFSDRGKVEIAEKLIRALRTLHAAGRVHGDLSPQNVFLLDSGGVIFLDPRLEIALGAPSVIGTTNYAAPETLTPPYRVNEKSDLYSLSALLYEIFESKPAFSCESIEEYALRAHSRTLALPVYSSTPRQFREAIRLGLHVAAEERPATVQQFWNFIQWRRYTRIALAVVTLLISLLVIVTYFLNARRSVLYDALLHAHVIVLPESAEIVVHDVGKSPFYIRRFTQPNLLAVGNAHSPYFTLLDIRDGSVGLLNRVPLAGAYSQDLALYSSGSRALITSAPTDSVVAFDLVTNKILHTFSNEVGRPPYFLHPDSIAVDSNTNQAYIGNWRGSSVTVLDLEKMRIGKKIDVFPEPSGAVYDTENRRIWVTHTAVRFNPEREVTEGVVTVIDPRSNSVVKTILNVGKGSSDIKLIPSASLAVTANFRGTSLSFIDAKGLSKLEDLSLGQGSPVDLFVSEKHPLIYVANFNHPYIHVVDYLTKTVRFVLKADFFGMETNGIVLDEDERYICETNTASNRVVCVENNVDSWLEAAGVR